MRVEKGLIFEFSEQVHTVDRVFCNVNHKAGFSTWVIFDTGEKLNMVDFAAMIAAGDAIEYIPQETINNGIVRVCINISSPPPVSGGRSVATSLGHLRRSK